MITLQSIKCIMLCALLVSSQALHTAPFVYVANTGATTVSVIDVATNSVIDTINMGTGIVPQDGIAISPDNTTVYVPCYNGSGSIQRIDVATNTPLPAISLGSLVDPDSIAITSNGSFAYVTATNGNVPAPNGEVLVINLSTNAISSIGSGSLTSPTTIVIAPNGLTAYVLDTAGLQVVPIDLTTNTLGTPIVGFTPAGLAVSPDSAYLYVSDQSGASQINQYNISGTHRLSPVFLQAITYPAIGSFVPTYLVIAPNGQTLYVSAIGGTRAIGAIDISNPASPAPSSTFLHLLSSTGPVAMAITSDSKSLYATITVPHNTDVVDITNRLAPTLTKSIPVGLLPAGLAITSALQPPSSIQGCKTQNRFLLQTDFINKITWTASPSGSPAFYNIYRDAALTQLIATVPASGSLQFLDHNRQPNVTYSYFITAVDSSGNQSDANSVTVTQACS